MCQIDNVNFIFAVPEENIANVSHGSQVIRGEMTQALLDGDTQTYDFDRGFTRHPIDGNNGQGIVVKLGQPYIINTIKMLLWDRDMRYKLCVFFNSRSSQFSLSACQPQLIFFISACHF